MSFIQEFKEFAVMGNVIEISNVIPVDVVVSGCPPTPIAIWRHPYYN